MQNSNNGNRHQIRVKHGNGCSKHEKKTQIAQQVQKEERMERIEED